jgi:hypothetical protein
VRRPSAFSTDLLPGARPLLPALKPIAGALLAGVLVLVATVAAAARFHEPVAVLTRDGSALGELPWYSGSISLLNGMVWAVVSGLSLLVAWLEPRARVRLAALGALTAVLAADDALQLHEVAGPDNGIPQTAFLALYAVIGVVLLVAFVRGRQLGPLLAFLVGLCLLGMSVGFDEFVTRQILIAEDGSKLLGAIVWLTVPVIVAGGMRARRELPAATPAGSALEREHQQA